MVRNFLEVIVLELLRLEIVPVDLGFHPFEVQLLQGLDEISRAFLGTHVGGTSGVVAVSADGAAPGAGAGPVGILCVSA